MPRLRPRIELVVLIAVASPLHLYAQGRDVDLLYGRWYQGNHSQSYELRTTTPLGNRFGHGLAAYAIVHDRLGRNRAFYGAGWELQALRHRQTFGPYIIAGAALGLSTDTAHSQLAALWSIGASLSQPIFHGGALFAQRRAAVDTPRPERSSSIERSKARPFGADSSAARII